MISYQCPQLLHHLLHGLDGSHHICFRREAPQAKPQARKRFGFAQAHSQQYVRWVNNQLNFIKHSTSKPVRN